jgi:hypothetical protein
VLVREQRKWEMQALDHFALISRVLGREAEEVIDPEGLQVGEVVAEGAGLRRAASRTGDHIPFWRDGHAGFTGSGIGVDDGFPL